MYLCCDEVIIQSHPRGGKRVSEKVEFPEVTSTATISRVSGAVWLALHWPIHHYGAPHGCRSASVVTK